MVELVEGEWKNFTFKMAKPEDYRKIIVHMRENFMVDEPLIKLLDYEEEDLKVLDDTILGVLHKGISFVAIENTSGDIAGVRLSLIVTKADKQQKKSEPKKPKVKITIGLLRTCSEGEGDVFKNFPDVDKYGDFFMASVGSKYRGQGLATEMYRRSIKFFKAQGVQVAKSNFTSPFTRKAAHNLGFVELKRIKFLDYKDDQGTPYLPTATEDQLCACMAVRI